MSDKKLPYWLAVEDSKPVKFADLAHMMARAYHPSDAESFAYAAARINLEEDLPKAVLNDELVVRNPFGLGRHTLPFGDALQRAVMLPSDLRPFLETRFIELRLIPHGSGPNYWTLENAAIAIAEQEQWHDGARGSLLDALMEAAASRALVVRDPHTDLPKPTGEVREFYELVTPADVNAWLEAQGAPYRWNVAAPITTPEPPDAPVAAVPSQSDDDWRAKARVIADRIGLEKYRTGMQQITARNICDAVANELALDKTTWGQQGPRGADNVRNEGLRGWKFTPPKEVQKVD